MPVEVILPKVDMDMATGSSRAWHVPRATPWSKRATPLFEIETDKAAMEIEAPASGIVRDITGKQGIDIPVGQVVAWIYAEGEVPSDKPEQSTAADYGGSLREPIADTVVTRDEVGNAVHVLAIKNDGAARATPLARRLAREAGLQILAIAGSGPRGRIVSADVEAAVAAAKAKQGDQLPSSVPRAPLDDQVLKLFEPELLRNRAARHDAADDRAPTGRSEEHHSTFLPDARLCA